MRFFRLLAIGVVLLLVAGSILGMACAGAQGEEGPQGIQGEKGDAGPQGLPGPNMIVAMGTVMADGTVHSGYNVTSVTYDTTWDYYTITLTGISYYLLDYVTLVSLVDSMDSGHTIESVSGGGKLMVYVYDDVGDRVPNDFHFVVLDATP